MSPIEQVLSCAKEIAISGKTPSMALLKARLGSSLPMPVLVQGLQRFKTLSKEEVAALNFATPAKEQQESDSPESLAHLQRKLDALEAQQAALLTRIDRLEKALEQALTNKPSKGK